MELNDELEKDLGVFPLFKFWGPLTTIESTKWIADSTIKVMREKQADLALVYLPHLDYNLQRIGPNDPAIAKDVRELDECIGDLRKCAEELDYDVLILSEYGIMEVDTPVHINRVLRKAGYIQVRNECNEEHFDAGASAAFAMADHQLAHVYVNDKSKIAEIAKLLSGLLGVAEVLVGEERQKYELDHERSGEIVCLAEKNAWFTYYYWLDDAVAPDYARAVDIHRKPGYDPVELFMRKGGELSAAKTLIKKKLGFRYLMDVIPLDANLVKGSHGVETETLAEGPLLIGDLDLGSDEIRDMKDFKELLESYFQNK
jgi:predicted AlkP superfamily pyrophosphatase or phosphodiesterase